MEVEIISKEAIKPSKPTQSCCKVHTLSSLDQLAPSIYVPVLLFYQAPSTPHEQHANNISSQLKNSLSETLTHYYPFAGKLKEGVCIECDDEGAPVLEARAKKKLVDFLTLPKLEELSTLFPDDLQWRSSKNSSVLAIQLSYFDCGGLSIGICISHKIADVCTIATFLNDWASHARLSGDDQFVIPELELTEADVVTRRYVFHPTKISELKHTIASDPKALKNPTRVEAVTSLIYKAIIQANKIRSLGLVKAYTLAQTVNMRPRMVPSLPRNSIGNVVWYFPVMIKDNDDISLERLATQMREGLVKLCNFAENVEGKKWLLMAAELQDNGSEHSMDGAYKVSSWCKHPVYEVDFGWGSPMWVSTAEYPYKNNIILMDTKDGKGIEAWITLDEEVMYILQSDEEFLEFASLNPSN
ncbi:Vinorine synthase [Bienertia sinuspersici]